MSTVTPHQNEEEYFARLEFERKRKAEQEKQARLQTEEKERLKELHHMHCPKCGMDLVEVDFKGIKIDKCSACDGVWLDAGELEAVSKLEKGSLGRLFNMFRE